MLRPLRRVDIRIILLLSLTTAVELLVKRFVQELAYLVLPPTSNLSITALRFLRAGASAVAVVKTPTLNKVARL